MKGRRFTTCRLAATSFAQFTALLWQDERNETVVSPHVQSSGQALTPDYTLHCMLL